MFGVLVTPTIADPKILSVNVIDRHADAVIDEVHSILKETNPDITRRQQFHQQWFFLSEVRKDNSLINQFHIRLLWSHVDSNRMMQQLVGQVAAEIRKYRGPEPYKGKGVRYANETIFRKEGKKK